jgi:hypothetical protein
MLTVLWNPHGFHVVTMLPLGASFNASWFIDQNLVPLLDRFFPGGRDPRQKILAVTIDNASAQDARLTQNFFQYNSLKRLPQPPYSPDISPSDLYRFGKVKNALIGHEIPDEIALLDFLPEMLGGIWGNELQAVFGLYSARISRVDQCRAGVQDIEVTDINIFSSYLGRRTSETREPCFTSKPDLTKSLKTRVG